MNFILFYNKFRSSNLRQALWPIRSFEFPKFAPMAILMFAILLNQNVVRSLKDTIVMTMVGAEVINFIKLWGEMPLGILFVMIYTKMCNYMSTEKAFRIIVGFFLGFYVFFAFVLYPYRDFFHPDPVVVEHLVNIYPNFKWFIIMWGKWSFILIYTMGELWPVIVFSLLFWQLANKITKTNEATRFYPFFSIFGQANSLIAGSVIIYFSSKTHFFISLFENISDSTEVMIKSLTIVILFSGCVATALQVYIEKRIIKNNDYSEKNNHAKNECDAKLELGFRDSLKLILNSRYLLYISTLLISYSFSINLLEGIWMFKAREMYPDPLDFIVYEGKVFFWTGTVTITFALFGSTIIRRFGWIWGAILTPLVMLITGGCFFITVIFQGRYEEFNLFSYHITPLFLVVIVGALQHVLCKGTKYSLFDATKEMTYIPLDSELKTKGKAAADILGSKIGKSAGALIQIILFTIFPFINYNDVAWFLAILFVIICSVWTISVVALSRHYKRLIKDN